MAFDTATSKMESSEYEKLGADGEYEIKAYSECTASPSIIEMNTQ